MPGPIHTIKMQFPSTMLTWWQAKKGWSRPNKVSSDTSIVEWVKRVGKLWTWCKLQKKYTARLDTKHDIRWQCNTKPKTIVIVETTIFKPTNTQNQKQTALSLCKVPGHRLYFRSNREAYLVVHVSSLYVLNLSKVFHSGRYKTKALGETLR